MILLFAGQARKRPSSSRRAGTVLAEDTFGVLTGFLDTRAHFSPELQRASAVLRATLVSQRSPAARNAGDWRLHRRPLPEPLTPGMSDRNPPCGNLRPASL